MSDLCDLCFLPCAHHDPGAHHDSGAPHDPGVHLDSAAHPDSGAHLEDGQGSHQNTTASKQYVEFRTLNQEFEFRTLR